MARGDAIAVIQAIGATTYVAVQPSSGVEWLINCWTANNNASADTMRAWNGSNYVYLNFGDAHSNATNNRNMKFIATHTTYFYIYNAQSSTQYQYYGGYVTKDT
jgi:hypothetical protein